MGTNKYNNISRGSISINKLAELIQAISRRNVGVKHSATRPADMKHWKVQTNKVREYLEFEATIKLVEDLREYMAWFEKNSVL